MKVSYDYEEFIRELEEEMEDGMLQLDDIIQILRADKPIHKGYRPIIDWYYSKKVMQEDLAIDPSENEMMIQEMLVEKQYEKDLPLLENTTVGACLVEMKIWNRIA